MKEIEKVIMEIVSQLHAPTALPPGTRWIGGSNDKDGVYLTTNLLNGVFRVSIKNEGSREINYGNCIAASRPDRITPGPLWIR
jgi:hypothetical protein